MVNSNRHRSVGDRTSDVRQGVMRSSVDDRDTGTSMGNGRGSYEVESTGTSEIGSPYTAIDAISKSPQARGKAVK